MSRCDTCTRVLDAQHVKPCSPARLVAVAILGEDGTIHTLPAPARHHDVIRHLARQGRNAVGLEQGFLTDAGAFVRRSVGARLALASGQIKGMRGSVLTSEDLW